jgi:hypothetical protein
MIGDQADCLARLKGVLPSRWFGSPTPILDGVMSGMAYVGSFIYSLYAYSKLQTRIKTATDAWLDLIAADYFGSSLVRATNQSDASFLAQILINILRERATRNGLRQILIDITGRTPVIFEPARPMDTGAYGQNAIGYGVAGGWGSLQYPFQAFVVAFRPAGTGVPNVVGYSSLGEAGGKVFPAGLMLVPQQLTAVESFGCYGTTNPRTPPAGSGYALWGGFIPEQKTAAQGSTIEYASITMSQGSVQDADIFAAVDSVKPVATTIWTRISS